MSIKLNQPVEPNLSKLAYYLEIVNKSGWYTNFGQLHQELTMRLEEFLGVRNLLLVSNGTIAIQVACKALDVKKAITTPFTFAATSSSLLWQGVEIEYADINHLSLNLDPHNVLKVIENDKGVDSIVATHVYGNPCDIHVFENIAVKNNVKVIYDAAHAFGVNCNGKSVLSYGDASTLSFHATKLFHTVEGGAVVFKREEDYQKAKQLINFGIKENGELGNPGINGKLSEYHCAVGLTVLDEVENILSVRKQLFSEYCKNLHSVVKIPQWHKDASFNGAYMPIVLKDKRQKDKVKHDLNMNNIQCREYFSPSLNKVYGKSEPMHISEETASAILCLPLHYSLSVEDVHKVIEVIRASVK